MQFKRNRARTAVDVVHCARCNFTSEDLGLTRCPRDGEVLGEVTVYYSPARAYWAGLARFAARYVVAVLALYGLASMVGLV